MVVPRADGRRDCLIGVGLRPGLERSYGAGARGNVLDGARARRLPQNTSSQERRYSPEQGVEQNVAENRRDHYQI